MDLLDGYEYVDLDKGTPYMRVTERGVSFSSGVCETMGRPQRVIFRVDESRRKCALQGVDVDDPRGTDFYSLQDMTRESITWKDRDLARRLAELGDGWDLCKESYILQGYALPGEDAVMFDIATGRPDAGEADCGDAQEGAAQ